MTPARHRLAITAALAATALLASGCTNTTGEDPSPAPSPTSSLSPAVEVLAEHDGYVAVTGNCTKLDWSPLQVLGLFETDPPAGFYVQGANPPDSICSGSFPIGGPGSTENLGTASVRLTLHLDERLAGNCGATGPDRAEGTDPVWDHIGSTIDISAEDGGIVMLDLRADVLCVNVFLTLDEGV